MFRVWGIEFRVPGFGFRVPDFGFRVSGHASPSRNSAKRVVCTVLVAAYTISPTGASSSHSLWMKSYSFSLTLTLYGVGLVYRRWSERAE